MHTDVDVIVVGGGMVGAVTALALADDGKRVAVVELNEPQNWSVTNDIDLRVSALSRASQRILSRLKVWDDIQSMRATPYQHMHVWDYASDAEIHFSAEEIHEPSLGHIVENSVIQTALINRLTQHASVRWLCPQSIQSFAAQADFIEVKTDKETLTAQLLVGADGARSRVRDMAGIDVQANAYEQKGVVAVIDSELGNQFTAWQRFLAQGPLALLPVSEDRSSIVWSLPTQDADEVLSLNDEAFCAALSEASEYQLGEIHGVGPRAAFPLNGSTVDRYFSDRVVLVGDAAHTIHPLAGQGVNLGFLDAAALLDAVRDYSNAGDPRALRAYERSRKGENELMLKAMEGFDVLFGDRATPLVMLRRVGLKLSNNIAPIKRVLIKQAMGLSGSLPSLAQLK